MTGEQGKRLGCSRYLKNRQVIIRSMMSHVDASTVMVTGATQKSTWVHPTRLCVQFTHVYVPRHTGYTWPEVYLYYRINVFVTIANYRSGSRSSFYRSIDRSTTKLFQMVPMSLRPFFFQLLFIVTDGRVYSIVHSYCTKKFEDPSITD